jgi:hypothetical protein
MVPGYGSGRWTDRMEYENDEQVIRCSIDNGRLLNDLSIDSEYE